MSLQFVVRGRVVSEEQFLAEAQQKKPRAPREQLGYHKGFRVVGHPPGAMEAAKRMCTAEEPFDEVQWRRNVHKLSVRSKPYSILDAAEVCAELARKEGWIDVDIIEIKKEAKN